MGAQLQAKVGSVYWIIKLYKKESNVLPFNVLDGNTFRTETNGRDLNMCINV